MEKSISFNIRKHLTVTAASRLSVQDNLCPVNPRQQGALRGKVSVLANSCTHIYPPAAIYGEGDLSPDMTPRDVTSALEDSKRTAGKGARG